MRNLLTCLSVLPGLERDLRLLPLMIRAGQTCVDIGAANGTYTFPLAALVGRRGSVVAVEPRPSAVVRIRRLARLLRLTQVSVEHTAVGSRCGATELQVPRRTWAVPGRSHIVDGVVAPAYDDGLRTGERLRVPLRTLDSITERIGHRVDFVKCDVEGAELDVFEGGAATLAAGPMVLCEVEPRHSARFGRSPDAVLARFEHAGYRRVEVGAELGSERNWLMVPSTRVDDVREALRGATPSVTTWRTAPTAGSAAGR